MGMFDKDRLYGGLRMDEAFNTGDQFIVRDITTLDEPVPTEKGLATKTLIKVSRMDSPNTCMIVGTLASAIADKAKDAEPDDFPAVVKLIKVPSRQFDTDATVLQFVAPWTGTNPDELPEWDEYLNQDESLAGADHPLG